MEPMQHEAVREQVRDWLSRHWDPGMPLREWRALLADSGWGVPTWPARWYGKGLSSDLAAVVSREFAAVGAVGPSTGSGMSLAAPTILEFGPDELRSALLRPTLTGEYTWCQLFSEPGSGSDLAGLTTRAERAGDEWIVNGQKVWTTGAATADYAMLLARTDWDVPKHRGITYFALPMRQPGVDVRPLRQANGYASFNEVFLTDARVPQENIVGALNDGWKAALATLAHERAALGAGRLGAAGPGGRGAGRAVSEAAAEAAAYARTYQWYPSRQGRPELIAGAARDSGASADAVRRQEIAYLHSLVQIMRWNNERARAARRQGRPGPEGSLAKLSSTRVARVAGRLHAAIAGAGAMLGGTQSPLGGIVAEITMSWPAISIAGGTDEIQRNILGERVLGLPKEPQVDTDMPFRQVRTNVRGR